MKCNDHPRSNTSVRLPVCVNKLKKWNEWNQSLEKEELRLWSSPVYTTCPGPLFVLSKARPETPGGFSLVCLMWQNSHFQVFMRLRKADKMLFFFCHFYVVIVQHSFQRANILFPRFKGTKISLLTIPVFKKTHYRWSNMKLILASFTFFFSLITSEGNNRFWRQCVRLFFALTFDMMSESSGGIKSHELTSALWISSKDIL